MPQAVVNRAADACGIEAEPYPVRIVHAVRSAVPPSVDGVLDEIGGIAVWEAEGLVNTGSEGGRTMGTGRARAWDPQTSKAAPYAAKRALPQPVPADPVWAHDRPEVGGGAEVRQECGQHP